VLDTSEDWIKNVEEWPANLQRKKKEEAQKEAQKPRDDEQSKHDEPKQEADVKRSSGPTKHHDAYVGDFNDDEGLQRKKDVKSEEEGENEYDKLRKKYTPQEIALLRMLQHEKEYICNLKQDDGKKRSPLADEEQLVSIDEVDQFTPDNWIPRSQSLIRLTGKHPLNAEPQLTSLFDAGLITPNALHFVRNHGPVPHLLWETHILEVDGIRLRLTMDELKNDFEPINIPVALACDGNRRKELNMLKRSKGYNWGAGAVSCAYWKGPLLRDILFAAGMPEKFADGKRYWVNFEGADELSEGAYATCIPFDYAMDPINDVILAYEMNNIPLPPDHGHPIRVIIPGYVGGRCVKWLSKIWLSDKENDSHYHIWDNRVLPSFITETDGEFANTMFTHPDTACNEQNINSVIFKPAHGEKIPLTEARKGKSYRIEGYAYDGGGHEIQRVEVSLDQGETWLYCVRKVRIVDFSNRCDKF
jgi:nitrate reductase (NAD(P)H)